MKNMKLFISFVLVVIVCVVMAGCGSRPSSGNEGWNDPNKPANQEWSNPENPDDQSWSDPDDYEDQDWNDPENYEDQDWRDPENPGTETMDPGESDHTGTYRHEIDGWVFYTEHNLDDYIRNEDGHDRFYASEMVADVFGYYDSFGRGSVVINSTTGNPQDFTGFTYGIYNGNNERDYSGDFYGAEIICRGALFFVRTPKDPSLRWCYIEDSSYSCSYELLEISLYASEHLEELVGPNKDLLNDIKSHLSERFYTSF